MKKYAYIFLLCITSCASQKTITKPVEVDIPVMVYCKLSALPEPEWNTPRLAGNAALAPTMQALLADYYLSQGYIKQLQAEIKACS